MLPLLEPHVTVYAMDRRGRGASGNGAAYAIEDEAADVAAVVDAVADATGGPVDVFGRFDPARFVTLNLPTLLLARADSPPELAASTDALAAALPDAPVVTMPGQGHVAMLTAPALFATELLESLRTHM